MPRQSHCYISIIKISLQGIPTARMPVPFVILALIPLLAFLGYLIIPQFVFILIFSIELVVACLICAVLSKVQ